MKCVKCGERDAIITGAVSSSWDTCVICTGIAVDLYLGRRKPDFLSVQPEWSTKLPLQQQSVLLLAARGPDGIAKMHPCKRVQRAYRASVLLQAYRGKLTEFGEYSGGSFMGLEEFANESFWPFIVDAFFDTADDLPHHFLMHLLHGAEILGYKHPDDRFRILWSDFYYRGVKEFHLYPESEDEMDKRLCDWDREHWNEP